MREVKFRAFDGKEIWPVTKIFLDVGFWEGEKSGRICKAPIMQGQIMSIMQYTGFKDKNGTEIYEGDIVEFNQHVTYEKIKADITFIGCGFTAHYQKSKSIEVWTDLPLSEEDQDTMKVIGNIYENPELL